MITDKQPGDLVWCVRRDLDCEPTDHVGLVFVAKNSECAVLSAHPFGYSGSISDYLIDSTRDDTLTAVYFFPLDDVYDNKKEAITAIWEEKS